MITNTCHDCRHYNPPVASNDLGECRAAPPVIVDAMVRKNLKQDQCERDSIVLSTVWPPVWHDDWCGAWEAKR